MSRTQPADGDGVPTGDAVGAAVVGVAGAAGGAGDGAGVGTTVLVHALPSRPQMAMIASPRGCLPFGRMTSTPSNEPGCS